MKTILVIENNRTFRVTLLEILRAEGFRTIAATNEMMGVQQAKLKLPDLILSEAQIPGFDGYAVLDALQQDDR
ncbi:response regulator, partial [Leptolyngbya sp. FACHB-36]|uniref:response regulator n=1 Tax=Leptolyngbya sp. FACHB-36 TaxID=2692808 RepID=UPI0016817D68